MSGLSQTLNGGTNSQNRTGPAPVPVNGESVVSFLSQCPCGKHLNLVRVVILEISSFVQLKSVRNTNNHFSGVKGICNFIAQCQY